jgi:dolichol-phosphate mannosyltransferase
MSRTLIIIPTYDEKENAGPISKAIFAVDPGVNILFVDANSPDGTGQLLDGMVAADARVFVIHQAGKQGLGRAYIEGFKWALSRGYDFVFEMDADFSHQPSEIPNFLKAAGAADLVLGSRYVNGIRITNWPLSRLLLSMGGALYVHLITGMPFTDPTGGFKCYRRCVLETLNLDRIKSNGYSFQIEMTHTAWMNGFRITEIPITFEDRRSGYSKMSSRIFREALWMVWRLALRNWLRRRPWRKTPPALAVKP